jgi:hypothetical protein
MNSPSAREQSDAEKAMNHHTGNGHVDTPSIRVAPRTHGKYKTTTQPFIGRLGGNQEFALDESDSANASKIKAFPDAAPCMSLRDQLDLRSILSLGLLKAAILEGMGMKLLFPINKSIDLRKTPH